MASVTPRGVIFCMQLPKTALFSRVFCPITPLSLGGFCWQNLHWEGHFCLYTECKFEQWGYSLEYGNSAQTPVSGSF